jgi:hypothetical protein
MRVWTNPAEWPGDVIVMAKIDGPFAVGAKITTRVCRRVELDVGRSNARMSFDCVTGVLPTAQGDLDARGGPAGAADMSGPA